jgi:HEAT repeat protein
VTPLRKPPVEVLDGIPSGEVRSRRPLSEGLAALAADDPEVRRRAVLELADEPEALSHLIERVGVEPDLMVREALCTYLARHDLPEVVDGLVEHLASDDAALRTAIAAVLQQTRTSTAARMPQLLADPDPDVRILTVMVLAGLRTPQVEDWLTSLVEQDPDPRVAAAAIGELVSLTGLRCVDALNAARARFPDDPFISFVVSSALAALDCEQR